MTEQLLHDYGAYGGSVIVAFIAGLFPLFSIEVFLMLISTVMQPTLQELLLCCLLATASHQVAKTLTYYAGVGALDRGRMKAKLEPHRARIDRWNKAPRLILALAGAFGIPPLLIVGFIARPLMRLGIAEFTAIVFVTRFARFFVLAVLPRLF